MQPRADDLPFDLRQLSIFLAVCDAGAMAAAARRLGLTQPAVSLAVAELEHRVGAGLFDRSIRPIGLTPAGVLLRQRASALVSEARQIAPMLREAGRGRFPLVRLGLVDSLSRTLGPALADALSARADEAAILSGLTASHASALLSRNLDVMIGVDDLGEVGGLERWPVVSEAYVLMTPPDAGPIPDVAALKALASRLEFVRFSARSSTGVEIERHLRRIGVEPRRRLSFDTPQGLVASVAEGGRFAIVTPLCVIEAGAAADSFVVTALPGPEFSRRLTLVAYDHELGRLPGELAKLSRERLAARLDDAPDLARFVQVA
ncbi:LysR family transcriptional regulator [Methylopila jiangsuensis]|uniref:LysR family transcriptional regulator n=1 Tax=Methylopila jiangsuensis TaxID=586230 RepID=A0A9W6N2R2_9HYPH|nr:LysR family transcriptional regulator [Methylopila jiangsuensis]MDR6285751.1 DNA-binding transcriptional LysR family regulator [Methylopila jiangsuensis]GLK75508.1 LysR family transcriptional regulator [Methylopila jiangsuensis]